jgi:hypothetical protein
MKRMTYATLIRKCEEGKMQVEAWDRDFGVALVTFFPAKISGRPTKHTVEVSGIPADVQINY